MSVNPFNPPVRVVLFPGSLPAVLPIPGLTPPPSIPISTDLSRRGLFDEDDG
jgi:hypothetical protein